VQNKILRWLNIYQGERYLSRKFITQNKKSFTTHINRTLTHKRKKSFREKRIIINTQEDGNINNNVIKEGEREKNIKI
jgi:hypothetical protein